jgi:hypothetical protein
VVAGGTLLSIPGCVWNVVMLPEFDSAYIAMPPITITTKAMPAQAAVLMPSRLVSRTSWRR